MKLTWFRPNRKEKGGGREGGRCIYLIMITFQPLFVGPTSFAPIINAAIDIVERSNGQYHVLVIIADGQVHGTCFIPCFVYSYLGFIFSSSNLFLVVGILYRLLEVLIPHQEGSVHKNN